MKRIRFSVVTGLLFILTAVSVASCKTSKPAESTTKADTTAQPKSNVHTSGKVQSGTFVNGPAKDTSSTGSKPR